MKIKDFADTTPSFLPEEFLTGRLEGWGIIESLTGGLQRRYAVQAEGRWDAASQSVLFTETWSFDDGHSDTLRWTIRKLGEGAYAGTEDRIKGEATGEQAGCAFHWTYSRDTPQPDGSSTTLNFDDWFYRIDQHAAMVRGSAGRLGLPFATAHVTYRRIA